MNITPGQPTRKIDGGILRGGRKFDVPIQHFQGGGVAPIFNPDFLARFRQQYGNPTGDGNRFTPYQPIPQHFRAGGAVSANDLATPPSSLGGGAGPGLMPPPAPSGYDPSGNPVGGPYVPPSGGPTVEVPRDTTPLPPITPGDMPPVGGNPTTPPGYSGGSGPSGGGPSYGYSPGNPGLSPSDLATLNMHRGAGALSQLSNLAGAIGGPRMAGAGIPQDMEGAIRMPYNKALAPLYQSYMQRGGAQRNRIAPGPEAMDFARSAHPFARGGRVPGMAPMDAPDTVPAMLKPGEVVLNQRQQKGVQIRPGMKQLLRPDEVKAIYAAHMRRHQR